MIHPFEVSDKYVITPLRVLLAYKLHDSGYSQLQISKILGISQPTINMYFKSSKYSKENMYKRLNDAGLNRSEIDGILNTLAQMLIQKDYNGAMKTMLTLSQRLLIELKLCDLHRKLEPKIPEDCRLCEDIFMLPKDNLILAELWDIYEKLSKNPNIAILIPEVLMNIAYSKEKPEKLEDIAAFPGRITRIGNSIMAFSKPSWGASRHLARILLTINKRYKLNNYRVVANIKVDRCIEKALSKLKIDYSKIQNMKDVTEDDIIEQVSLEIARGGGKLKAIIHEGGKGFEPITYIFSSSPYELVYYLTNIAEICSKNKNDRNITTKQESRNHDRD